MKPEIKKRWVEALRSGDYKQGTKKLKNEDEYCCLGVLCDIVKDELELEWKTIPIGDEIDDCIMLPPIKVMKFCSMDIRSPITITIPSVLASNIGFSVKDNNSVTVALSYLNDVMNLDFKEIAYLIEKYL